MSEENTKTDVQFKDVYTTEQASKFMEEAVNSSFKGLTLDNCKKAELLTIIGDLIARLGSEKSEDVPNISSTDKGEVEALRINIKILTDENAELKQLLDTLDKDYKNKLEKMAEQYSEKINDIKSGLHIDKKIKGNAPVRIPTVPGHSRLILGDDNW